MFVDENYGRQIIAKINKLIYSPNFEKVYSVEKWDICHCTCAIYRDNIKQMEIEKKSKEMFVLNPDKDRIEFCNGELGYIFQCLESVASRQKQEREEAKRAAETAAQKAKQNNFLAQLDGLIGYAR